MEVQEKTFIVETCTPIPRLCQMLTQAFYHLQYNMHMIFQAYTHILYRFLSTNPLGQSTRGQGHVSPKINRVLFKSSNSIKLIFVISADGSAARKYLSFICLWITMHYTVICIHRLHALGCFFCACVCCDQICICVL